MAKKTIRTPETTAELHAVIAELQSLEGDYVRRDLKKMSRAEFRESIGNPPLSTMYHLLVRHGVVVPKKVAAAKVAAAAKTAKTKTVKAKAEPNINTKAGRRSLSKKAS